jgi:hypothetical protein
MNDRQRHARIATVLLCLIVAACGETEVPTMPVNVNGSIIAPAGVDTDGTVYVSLYHAWALQGDLRHPVQFISSHDAAVGSFSLDIEYPVEKGEGLLVYAWLDNDGDGVLCTPEDRDDLAGLTEVDAFPAEQVTVEIQLNAPCAGPDWFYPPAP